MTRSSTHSSSRRYRPASRTRFLDRARLLGQRVSAWPVQWLCLALAVPFLLFEDVWWQHGWYGVGLLAVQQALRCLNHAERRRRLDLDVAWPALGLASMGVVGLAVSPPVHYHWSLAQFFGLLFNVAVYTAIVSSLRAARPGADPLRRLWVALVIYAGLGVLVAMAAVLQAEPRRTDFGLVTALRDARPEIPRPVQVLLQPLIRTTTHPNTVAGALALFLPLYVALFLYRPWRGADRSIGWPVATGLALAFVGLVFVSTLSRGGFIAVALSLLLLLAWRWRHTRPAAKALAIGLVMLLGLSWCGSLVWGWPSPLGFVAQAVNSTRVERASSTFGARMDGWIYAIELIAQHPLTGIGLSRARAYLVTVDPWLFHAHNLFLQVALDLGLPGLLFFAALLAIALVRLYRALRSLAETPHEGIAVGLAAGLVAHLVWSMADTMPLGLTPTVLLWVLLGLAVSLPAARPVAGSEATEIERAGPVPGGSGIVVGSGRQPSNRAHRRRSRARVGRG